MIHFPTTRLRLHALLVALALGVAGCSTLTALLAEPPLTRGELNALEAAAECDVAPINARTDTTGTLRELDCIGMSREAGSPFPAYSARPYRSAGQWVDYYGVFYRPGEYRAGLDVRMTSDDFDGYLVLLDKNGRVVGQNDDGGGGLNPRVTMSLVEGAYVIAVTSRRAGETGPYRLQVGVASRSD